MHQISNKFIRFDLQKIDTLYRCQRHKSKYLISNSIRNLIVTSKNIFVHKKCVLNFFVIVIIKKSKIHRG